MPVATFVTWAKQRRVRTNGRGLWSLFNPNNLTSAGNPRRWIAVDVKSNHLTVRLLGDPNASPNSQQWTQPSFWQNSGLCHSLVVRHPRGKPELVVVLNSVPQVSQLILLIQSLGLR